MPQSSQSKTAVSGKNITIAFGRNTVFKDLSFQIPEGKITALIGPNGSGKTTLVKAILGLIKLHAGSITLFEKNRKHSLDRIGYVPQAFQFDASFPLTVKEFLLLAKKKETPLKNLDIALKEVGLTKKIYKHQIGTLSGGQLQRVLIAQAILNEPSFLILDEPSTGIDIGGEAAFYDIIHHLNKEHQTTILIISHDVSMIAKNVDEVICLNKKVICCGSPSKALTEKNIKKLFGHKTHLHEH